MPGHNSPAFLVDGRLLLDAGTIGTSLRETRQWKIRNILITHAHLDHIKAIPFLADNIVIKKMTHSITLISTQEILNTLRDHLLNNQLWPDFTRISASIDPVVRMHAIVPGKRFSVDGYEVTAWPVSHSVPAVGYILKDGGGSSLLYTGDTGPTEKIWAAPGPVSAAIIEVSFPDSMEELALMTGHLTPRLLQTELGKAKNPLERILVTHIKPQYTKAIMKELGAVKKRLHTSILVIRDGRTYEI